MEPLIVIGYMAAILIGVSLGLTGGGGSILTVPVMVYLMGTSPVVATAYSLFVVGFSSVFGTFSYIRKDLVSFRVALLFGLPSIVGVLGTRKYLMPALPNELFTLGSFTLTKDLTVMMVFAILMIAASFSMIKKKKGQSEEEEMAQTGEINYLRVVMQGLAVGTLTGFVGAGGGFLIIPALVVFTKLPMKKAVGTSLMIIAINSLIGFTGGLSNYEINWFFLATFSLIAVVGIFIGSWLSNFVSGQKLKPAFGVFVLVMGIYIIFRELIATQM